MRILLDSIFSMIFSMRKKNVIGSRVRKARKDAKPPITQLDLVARLGVQKMKIDQSAISKIENGTRPVYDFELPIIAKALKVDVGWLLKKK
jgi:transcriptional regulator with XRE-family HTH domain